MQQFWDIEVSAAQVYRVTDTYEKWVLPCEQIGEVTNEKMLRFYMNDTLDAELLAEGLVLEADAPVYEREYREPKYFEKIKAFDASKIPVPKDLKSVAEKLISLPSIASWKMDI